MHTFVAFMAWQIAILPHVAAVSFGLGMMIFGVLFFWKAFWPEFWEDESG